MKLRHKLTAIISSLVVASVGFVAISQHGASATANTGSLSGLPWIHGAYLDHQPENVALFQTDTGKNLDAVEVFTSQATSAQLTDNWWLNSAAPVTNAGGNLILSVPLWAVNQTVNTDTSSMFTTLGNEIKAAGLANRTYVRLGWEMNNPIDSQWYWGVTTNNVTTWKTRFANASAKLKATAPGIKVVFNPNAGASGTNYTNITQLATDLKASYDYVGPDQYNWYNQADNATSWNAMYTKSYGMKQWEDFAIANGKGYALPEWGGAKATNNSTGVYYAQQVIARFKALGAQGVPVLESYFAEPASYMQNTITRYQLDGSSTINSAQMAAMGSAYKAALATVTAPTTSPTVSSSPTATPTTPGC